MHKFIQYMTMKIAINCSNLLHTLVLHSKEMHDD